jgi:sugar lactone lactonase YvrE
MSSPSTRLILHRHVIHSSWLIFLSSMLLVVLMVGTFSSAHAWVKMAGQAQAMAPSAHVDGLVSTFGTAVVGARGTAVDASGNVYIATKHGAIYKESFAIANGTYTQTTIATTSAQASDGIAVDGTGTNVFVSTGTGNAVEWYTGSGTSYTLQKAFSGFSGAAVATVDQGLNVYIADEGSGIIYKETYSGGGYAQTQIATGFSRPEALTVDSNGNVFVGDRGTEKVSELTGSGSTYAVTPLAISGLSHLQGIAVDAVGDLYIESAGTIIEAALNAGSYSTSVFYPYDGQSLALDKAGNLYFGSTDQITETKLTIAPSFGSVAVGTAALQMPITFTLGSQVTLGTPTAVTQGTAGLDFTLGTGSTCTGAQAVGSTCVVNVALTPLAVGARLGAVNLFSSDGTLMATALVSGIGTGPQVLFQPGVPGVVYSTNLSTPRGLSLDSAGNLYLANQAAGMILKFSLSAGSWTALSTVCGEPGGTAVDGAGNVYFGCASDNTMYELVGGKGNAMPIAAGIGFDDNLSVDGAGNLFSSNAGSGAIVKISAGTHAVTTLYAGNVGQRFVGMAIDANGNLFAPDFNNSILYELVAGASSLTVLASGSPLSNPHAIAVDSAGDLYVSNYHGNNVYRYAVANYAAPVTLSVTGQTSLVIDNSGAIYSIVNDSTLEAHPRSTNPSMVFPETAVGGTSLMQTVTLENDGNASLTFLPGANGNNPSVSAGFTIGNSSTCCPQLLSSSLPALLIPGASCTDVVSFAPVQAGSVSGSLITLDDSLNAPGTSQSVALSGTATAGTPVVSVENASATVFSAATLTAVVSGSGVAPEGAVTFRVAAGPAVGAICTEGTSAETCSVRYPTSGLVIGANPISVSYAADINYVAASGVGTLVLTAAAPTISWPSPAPYVYPTPLSATQLNASASVAGSYVYTPAAGTVLEAGAGQTLSVTFTPTDNVNYATTTAAVSVTVTQAAASILWAAPMPVPYGTALSATQLNATSGLAGTFQYTPALGTVLGVGAQTLSVSFLPDDPGYTVGAQTVSLVVTGSPGFPSTAVGNTSSSVNVLVGLNNAASISSISAPISQGGKQEYGVGAVSGCVVDGSTVNVAGTVCTVAVTFSPGYPGTRNVPLQVVTSEGGLSVGLTGMGAGPQAALTPGTINTVAGTGMQCADPTSSCGDNARAVNADLYLPVGLAVDSAGNLYIAEYGNQRVREVAAATALITTIAGDGNVCSNSNTCGDGGAATSSTFNYPTRVALDSAGNVYVVDYGDDRIRLVAAGTGIIGPAAGNGTPCSSPTDACGDGGAALAAQLTNPFSATVDDGGNLYIADRGDNRVRMVAAVTGIITTVAGNGKLCADSTSSCGDGGKANNATLSPSGVAVDHAGNLYISDSADHRIRKVAAGSGVITTLAGTGAEGSTSMCGDGGPASSATLSEPYGLALDSAGNLYIADVGASRVRKVSAGSGIITTVAGSGAVCASSTGSCGDGGAAPGAAFDSGSPQDVAVDSAGNLYITDTFDHRIRKVDVSSANMSFAATAVGATSVDSPQASTLSNIGNGDLSFSIPGIGNNPSVSAGYSLAAGTTCPQLGASSSVGILTSGADCTVSVNFIPVVSGAANGTLTVADNALNNIASTLQISLSGTGFQNAPVITWAVPAAIVYGTALSSMQLNATASVAGAFVYSPAAGTIPGVGPQTLTVTFTPTDNASYSSVTSTTTLTVTQAVPVITWAIAASIPYGTVLNSAQLDATANTAGTFVYSPSAGTLPVVGSETLSVTFTPTDATDYQQATGTVVLTVGQATSTTVLSASSRSLAYGASVVLTASVVSGGNPVTSGVVTFLNNGASIGTGTVSSGAASLSVPTLPTGTDFITATYVGTADFGASTSNAVSVGVATDTTTTTLSASSTTAAYGANVVLTATVNSGGTPVGSGVITFLNNGMAAGTGAIVSGVASLSLATLPTGTDVITASYGGTADLGASISNAVSVGVAADTTTTNLSASSTNLAYGASVVLTATVNSGGTPVSSGVVTFLNNGMAVGTGAIVNGVASYSLAILPTGTNMITAAYGGALNFGASTSSAVVVTVVLDTTTTGLSAIPTKLPYGASVALTATVVSGGIAVTSGVVTFLSNGTSIGTGPITDGVATLNIATLPTGTDVISAAYGGSLNFGASASSAVSVMVMAPSPTAPSETITVSKPLPVLAGGVASATTKLMAGDNYAGSMKLTCVLTSAPAGAQSLPTCSFGSATLTVEVDGVASTQLSIQTTAATRDIRATMRGINLWELGGGSALAGLLMFWIPSRRRRLISIMTGLLLMVTIGTIGCGAGLAVITTPPTSTAATTSGLYAFTITATDTVDPSTTTSAVVTVDVE